MLTILALDISSTHIGLCYDGQPLDTIVMLAKWDIARRCAMAAGMVGRTIDQIRDIDLVVYEEPVGKFIKAIIPQCNVQGAILALLSERGLAWTKIAPTVAKKALTGKGNADKSLMISVAGQQLGRLVDEHAADAYALWVAARVLKAEKVAA